MTRSISNLLDTDDLFPTLVLQTTSGETLTLPDESGDSYAVFMIYRGDW